METIITQIIEKMVEKIYKIFNKYEEDMTKMSEMIEGVKEAVVTFGLKMIKEEWENCDKLIRERKDIREGWNIVKKDERSLITSIGEIRYERTMYKKKETGERKYLLDEVIGIGKRERISEDLEAEILKKAVNNSYEESGKTAGILVEVSKESVKNKIHKLKFPKEIEEKEIKKEVKQLYIDADEDHIAIQNKKGGEKINKSKYGKIVYVYEGIEKEGKRNKLKNVNYFCRVCEKEENKEYWREINKYIENNYETEKIERIQLNSDAGSWIKRGMKEIEKVEAVLDGFHLSRSIEKIARYGEEKEEARKLRNIIKNKSKKEFEEELSRIIEKTKDENGKTKIIEQGKYILNNWTASKNRLKEKNTRIGSSTEGHVSHILSDRMSSRPMAWSVTGADKMVQLRSYYFNGGDMLELVRFQKEDCPLEEDIEEIVLSATQIIRSENKNRKKLGNLADIPTYSIPYVQVKKIAALKAHILGI